MDLVIKNRYVEFKQATVRLYILYMHGPASSVFYREHLALIV